MTTFGQIAFGMGSPEELVGDWAIVALFALAAWRVGKWFRESDPAPDPWDETLTAGVAQAEATPLCHRCLAPHDAATNFCPGCGTPVGQYTNWLPFPQLFSIGHVLRTGTSGEFKRTPLTVAGFMLFAVVEYAVFAPIYWIVFLRKLSGQTRPGDPPVQSPPGHRGSRPASAAAFCSHEIPHRASVV